jgi:pimeloyl-ACP methyl ester carboxylesterase
MLGPGSRLLTALIVVVAVALLVGAIRLRLVPLKALCGALSIVVAMVGGIAAVNYYYGYYTTWGELFADFQGTTGNLGTIPATSTDTAVQSGRIGWIDLPGKLSGYDRRGLLYLPPQYGEAQYARTRFPVVELFHGTPGTPLTWNTVLKISQVANSLISRHLIGPMVLVMPSINGSGHQYQDCVNGPKSNDETYLLKDVRNDVFARYRVSRDSYEWAAAGYSSGGYCSANLALRHRGSFGAAAVINGYFRAADGPAGGQLNKSGPLEADNSPLYLAERLTPTSTPLPAFWVAAGNHDKTDYAPATVFTAALNRLEQVPFYQLGAGDTANAWDAALPVALTWLWQQLAPPDLRVLFPVRTTASNGATLPVRPIKRDHHQCKPATQPGTATLPCPTSPSTQAPVIHIQYPTGGQTSPHDSVGHAAYQAGSTA